MKKLLLVILSTAILVQLGRAQITPDEQFILDQMEINHVPGLSAVVIIDDSVYWNGNYGYMRLWDSIPVHDSTLFNVFSIGKTVTTACNMRLWDDQLFGLDQNINDFIPFGISNPYNGDDSITARMLMTHTSTIDENSVSTYVVLGDPTEPLASFMENYLDTLGDYYSSGNFYNAVPGTSFHYDNYGIGMLGYLVEALTGIEFSIYAQDSLFEPLDIKHSAWFLSELNADNLARGYTYSGGNYTINSNYGHPAYPGLSLRTTALDLANFNIMFLNQGNFDNTNILSTAAIDSMTRIQNPAWTSSYGPTGLGIFVREDLGERIVWGHNGGGTYGYAGQFYFCMEEKTGVVITTNSEQWMDDLVEYFFDFALSVITDIPDENISRDFKINIYPNPASDMINIQCSEKIEEVTIFCLTGKEVLDIRDNTNVNISALPSGIYILEARTEDGVVRSKFVKR